MTVDELGGCRLRVGMLVVLACGVLGGCAPVPQTRAAAVLSTEQLLARRMGSGLVAQEVQGMRRICTYGALAPGGEPRRHETGLGERCPPTYSTPDPNVAPPPVAQLRESRFTQGRRLCIYEQGSQRWTYMAPPEEVCPVNAGMAEEAGLLPDGEAGLLPGGTSLTQP